MNAPRAFLLARIFCAVRRKGGSMTLLWATGEVQR